MTRKDPGSAHSGVGDWYWQRLSAAVLLVLLLLPLALLGAVYAGALDQLGLLDILDHIVSRLLHTILILALIIHAFLGLKVVVEDYVHNAAVRVPLMGLLLVVVFGFCLWWLAMIWAWGI